MGEMLLGLVIILPQKTGGLGNSWNKLGKGAKKKGNSLEKHTAEEIFNHEYIQSILPLTWKDPSHDCTWNVQEMWDGFTLCRLGLVQRRRYSLAKTVDCATDSTLASQV